MAGSEDWPMNYQSDPNDAIASYFGGGGSVLISTPLSASYYTPQHTMSPVIKPLTIHIGQLTRENKIWYTDRENHIKFIGDNQINKENIDQILEQNQGHINLSKQQRNIQNNNYIIMKTKGMNSTALKMLPVKDFLGVQIPKTGAVYGPDGENQIKFIIRINGDIYKSEWKNLPLIQGRQKAKDISTGMPNELTKQSNYQLSYPNPTLQYPQAKISQGMVSQETFIRGSIVNNTVANSSLQIDPVSTCAPFANDQLCIATFKYSNFDIRRTNELQLKFSIERETLIVHPRSDNACSMRQDRFGEWCFDVRFTIPTLDKLQNILCTPTITAMVSLQLYDGVLIKCHNPFAYHNYLLELVVSAFYQNNNRNDSDGDTEQGGRKYGSFDGSFRGNGGNQPSNNYNNTNYGGNQYNSRNFRSSSPNNVEEKIIQLLHTDESDRYENSFFEMLLWRVSVANYAKVAKHILKEKHINPNTLNNHGVSPLHLAVFARNQDVLRVLVEYGADPNLADIYGNTCLDISTLYKYDEITELLMTVTKIPVLASSFHEDSTEDSISVDNNEVLPMALIPCIYDVKNVIIIDSTAPNRFKLKSEYWTPEYLTVFDNLSPDQVCLNQIPTDERNYLNVTITGLKEDDLIKIQATKAPSFSLHITATEGINIKDNLTTINMQVTLKMNSRIFKSPSVLFTLLRGSIGENGYTIMGDNTLTPVPSPIFTRINKRSPLGAKKNYHLMHTIDQIFNELI